MNQSNSFLSRWWLVIPLCAALFILATDYGRMKQVERVRDVDLENRTGAADYSGGRHWLVVPEHNSRSYQWLSETEQMLTQGEWRLRQTSRENVPAGREVHSASPYRWWLGLLTWIDHQLSGRPIGQSVEQAALWAGPLLHLLLLAGSTMFVARRFGTKPAALLSVGLAVLFPVAGEFLPGVPDDHGLAILCAWWSVLFLAAGLQGDKRFFIYAGVAGGLGLWVGVATEVPVLAGIGGGALLLAMYDRISAPKKSPASVVLLPWNSWALAGAVTSLLAYLLEYFPAHLEMRLEANHPLYGIAWIGLGQLLSLAESWRTRQTVGKLRIGITLVAAIAGLTGLPIAMHVLGSPAFLVANPQATRLTSLPNGGVAPNFALWLAREGPALAKVAVCLPLLLLVPLVLAWRRRDTPAATKRNAVFVSGALLVCLALACSQLQWWGMTQLVLLTLVAVAIPLQHWRGWVLAGVALLPGLLKLADTARVRDASHFTALEIEGLVERDIAHWIADHAETTGAVVLVSPERTPGLCFHGGLRGLGSPNWENRDGVAATVRIIDATTADEAQALLNQHGVTHIVLASWDTDLDEFVRWTKNNPNDTFLAALHHWAIPPWLQPVPYRLPDTAGFEGQSVVILKVTENTDRALSLSRMAEYFLEVQNTDMAASTNEVLKSFPANLGALIGRAQIEKAKGDSAAFDQVFATIQQNLSNGLDRLLPWDRRVSLAVVLAQGNRTDLARAQVQRCLAELNEDRLRSLTTAAVFRLQVLAKALDLKINDEPLHDLAVKLVPAELRSRL